MHRQAGRQADKQAGRQADRPTYIDTHVTWAQKHQKKIAILDNRADVHTYTRHYKLNQTQNQTTNLHTQHLKQPPGATLGVAQPKKTPALAKPLAQALAQPLAVSRSSRL